MINSKFDIELLAPGGSKSAIEAACMYGADAVYFGVGSLNARSNAENISAFDLSDIVSLLHSRAVKGYLTQNILLRDYELPQALEIAKLAAEAHIDGIIVQDLGLVQLLKEQLPEIPLHASTQMTITDEHGLHRCAQLGISRVVLPRELNAESISRLTNLASKLNMETEVFIHGALCINYSGQCLISGIQKNRSANRGNCSQPCRLSYRINDYSRSKHSMNSKADSRNDSAVISPKDQALINHLPELIAAGVKSFKIEGRMRSSDYVALTVAEYRRVLDQVLLNNTSARANKRQLLVAFNRGGDFTDRYYADDNSDDFLTGNYPGSFGLYIGKVVENKPIQGILKIKIEKDIEHMPARGDILSIRSSDQEIASAPIGIIENTNEHIMVKAFHPDIMQRISLGDMVYQMSDNKLLREVKKKQERRINVKFLLKSELFDEAYSHAYQIKQDNEAQIQHGSNNSKLKIKLEATIVEGPCLGLAASVNQVLPKIESDISLDRIKQQLAKTGGTQFHVSDIEVCDLSNNGINITVGQLNTLRREAISSLQKMLIGQQSKTSVMKPKAAVAGPTTVKQFAEKNQSIQRIDVFYQRLPDKIEEITCGADNYILPLWSFDEDRIKDLIQVIRMQEPDSGIFYWLPPAPQNEISFWLDKVIEKIENYGIDGLCSGHPADIRPANSKFKLQLDAGLNITNYRAFDLALTYQPEAVSFAAELTFEQIAEIINNHKQDDLSEVWLTLPIYGRQRLMSSVFCPVGQNQAGCRKCYLDQTVTEPDNAKLYDFFDQTGKRMILQTHPLFCTMDLLDSRVLLDKSMLHHEWAGKTAWRLHFLDEEYAERKRIVSAMKEYKKAKLSDKEEYLHRLDNTVQKVATRIADGVADRRKIYD